MNQNNINYSDKKKSKKKIAVIIAMFAVATFIAIGTVFAYYSDIFTESGEVKSATLSIDGTYTFYLNGTETLLADITSLNPGDVIVAKGAITNSGVQSAWIRDKISFSSAETSFLDYIKVFHGEFTSAELISEDAEEENRITTIESDAFVSGNSVINGVGTNARTESTGDFAYLDSTTYAPVLTIYFMHTAPNATQNQTISLSLTTQALQFINNNTAEPDAAAWATVQAETI